MSFAPMHVVWLFAILLVVSVQSAAARDRVSVYGQDYDYLKALAEKITTGAGPPETLEAYKALRPELREQCLDILGLKPLPDKTPLKVEWLGEPVELGPCTLRKLTFYSAPEVLTPCYLFLPSNAGGRSRPGARKGEVRRQVGLARGPGVRGHMGLPEHAPHGGGGRPHALLDAYSGSSRGG